MGLPPPKAMALLHPSPPGKLAGNQLDLGAQGFEIARQPLRLVGSTSVAAAVPADFMAVRNVDVERDRLIRPNPDEHGLKVARAYLIAELGRGGVAGVAGHRRCQQIGMIDPIHIRAYRAQIR